MTSLSQIYTEHTGKLSDKWSLYLQEYETLFRQYIEKPICILEIGIQNGGSLEIWSKYFKEVSKIVGCDIDPKCRQLKYSDPRISVIALDANTDDAEKQIELKSSGFDIVIDDGSHISKDIIKSFVRYFPKVSVGGMFVVEDLHCSYWKSHGGGLYHPYSSISFFKKLVDTLNSEHFGINIDKAAILKKFEKEYKIEFSETLLSQVKSIEFINSMCIIKKSDPSKTVLGKRVVSGQQEQITTGLKSHNNCQSIPPDETTNELSNSVESIEEKYLDMLNEINLKDNKIKKLESHIATHENSRLNKIKNFFKKIQTGTTS